MIGLDGQRGELARFWEATFPAGGTRKYVDPNRLVAYQPHSLPDIVCVAEQDPDNWVDNALYCPSDMTIGYDANWLQTELHKIGRLAPIMILSHEWGHHIQNLRGRMPDEGVRRELQADCFAGLFAEHASRVGLLVQGEINASLFTFFDLGARYFRSGTSWFAVGNHGSATERARAFAAGMATGDVGYCLPYADYMQRPDEVVGPFSLGVAPGLTIEHRNGVLVVTGQRALAKLAFVPDVRSETDAATLLTDQEEPLLRLQPGYENAIFESRLGGGLGRGVPGSSASVLYERITPDGGFAHGNWILHVLPTGGELLLNVEVPGRNTDNMRSVLDFEFLLTWDLCVAGFATYTCALPDAPLTGPSG
jgi:hypothetical protein